jgi:hypothetical protein
MAGRRDNRCRLLGEEVATVAAATETVESRSGNSRAQRLFLSSSRSAQTYRFVIASLGRPGAGSSYRDGEVCGSGGMNEVAGRRLPARCHWRRHDSPRPTTSRNAGRMSSGSPNAFRATLTSPAPGSIYPAALAMLERSAEAAALMREAIKVNPDRTVEGWVNEPSYPDRDRALIERTICSGAQCAPYPDKCDGTVRLIGPVGILAHCRVQLLRDRGNHLKANSS